MSDERRYETARYDTQRIRETDRRMNAQRSQMQTAPHAYAPPRRERRRGLGFLRFLLWLLFVVLASLALSGVGWLLANDFAALNKEPLTAMVQVTKDDDLSSIADKLKEAGLIEYKWFFMLFGKVAHAESKVGIGTYELNTEMDYSALIHGMRSSSGSLNSATVRVVIPEGYTVKQIVTLLSQYGVCSEEDLTEAAKNHDFDYSFLDRSRKGSLTYLEGYLFPDTYEFYVDSKPETALNKILSNFNAKLTPELKEKVEASGYTLDQIVNMASLIEKETDGHDRKDISAVIHNRLTHVTATNYRLQIDAAQIYGLGDRFTPPLTKGQLEIDTPYNTYLHEGLPPTPIANPGLASIEAALEPSDSGYYYYALGKDGQHHFSKSYEEHQAFLSSLR